ncbi:MAG: sulfotransferase [Propionibacterium sp.]|nr:sulfotransferase [Propionibacterium sp.]
MSAPAPHRPLPIKVMNTVGGLAATVGLKPSLTPESIMAAAAKKTGLDDFGPDTFRPGLDALCWSLEHEAELHTLGRIAARASLLGRMEARLQLIDWRKKHPEVFEEKLEKPIFALGLPRTGTTVLYGLLAANPALRDPVTWEVNSPVPPPRPDDAAAGDPRVEVSRKSMAGLRQLAPAVDAIHPMGEMLPQECITLHMPEFHSYEAVVTFHVPGYFEFLKREGRQQLEQWSWGLDRMMAFRETLPADRVIDVYFRDTLADPVGTVHRIHEHFGMEITPQVEQGVQRYLADNPRDKHGTHTYSLADFGLTREQVDSTFAEYKQRFEVPDEN